MYRKNVAGQTICFQMLLTATGAVATGLAPAVRRCIDGTFAAGTGTVTEDSGGFYKYAMSQADTNGNDISLRFSAATAMPICLNFITTAADPTDAVRLGLTNLDATVTSRMASYAQPTGFLAATFPTGTVANTTNITGGTITTATNLTNAPTAGDLTATMKTSVTTAATAATPTVAGVTARVTANVDQLNGDTTAAAYMAKTTAAIGRCTVTTGGTTTSIPTSASAPVGVVADQFKGRIITFDANTTTTALRGQSTDITASSAAASPTFTVTALTTAPASGDTFSIT